MNDWKVRMNWKVPPAFLAIWSAGKPQAMEKEENV